MSSHQNEETVTVAASPVTSSATAGEGLVAHGYLIRAGKQPTYYKLFPGNVHLKRSELIICRTARGVELAEVLDDLHSEAICNVDGTPEQSMSPELTAERAIDDLDDNVGSAGEGSIGEGISSWPQAKWLRIARHEDQFLLSKLEEMSRGASDACQRYLEEQNSSDVLLEVEPLLDGRTLYFHFLGEPASETESVIDRLAKEYQSNVAKSRFAELVEKGCGPGCGTKEKGGCGTSQGCAVCAIAGGCTSK